MRTLSKLFVLGAALIAHSGFAFGANRADVAFYNSAMMCAPDVDKSTLAAIASVESGFNPYAIGVVGGRLERQPRSYGEALATAASLERLGFNFSMGLIQVNRFNLERLGENYQTIFDPCHNLRAGSKLLAECFTRAKSQGRDDQAALRAAFSCYYSGNFTTGFREGYVSRVLANAATAGDAQVAASGAIPVIRGERSTKEPKDAPQEGSVVARDRKPWVFITDDEVSASPDTAAHREQRVEIERPEGNRDTKQPAPISGNALRSNQSPVNVRVAPDASEPQSAAQRALPRATTGEQSKDTPFVEIVK